MLNPNQHEIYGSEKITTTRKPAAAGVFMPLGSKGLVLNKAVQTKASEFDRIRLNANETHMAHQKM